MAEEGGSFASGSQQPDRKRARTVPLLMEIMLFLSGKDIDADTALSLEAAQREAPLNIDSEGVAVQGAIIAHISRVVCVPVDGTCFYYYLVACRDLRSWIAEHDGQVLVYLGNWSDEMRQKRKACLTL